jgi:hypothetical protein
MNVEIATESAQFSEKEYINVNFFFLAVWWTKNEVPSPSYKRPITLSCPWAVGYDLSNFIVLYPDPDPDRHQSDKQDQDPDPHPDLHQSDADP